jgi:hypothetical protein
MSPPLRVVERADDIIGGWFCQAASMLDTGCRIHGCRMQDEDDAGFKMQVKRPIHLTP